MIHQIWIGERIPDVLARFMQTWRVHHPEWTHVVWTSADLPLRNAKVIAKAREYVPERNVGQFVADVMRYEILAYFGGVYVDCDFECKRPIDELLENIESGAECFAAWEKQDVWVNNAIMGAAPHSSFITDLVEALPWSVHAHRGSKPNVMTGPQFVTRRYREHPEGLTVFDQELFYPYSWSELDRRDEDFPNAYAVHHWGNKAGLSR